MVATYAFLKVRQEIGSYGKLAVESCTILKCNMNPLGMLDCSFNNITPDMSGIPYINDMNLTITNTGMIV